MPLLILFLSIAQALWIDVPFVRQDKNGCGSAVVWMVMEHWRKGSAPAVTEIHRKLFSPEAGGVFARDIEKYLASQGFSTFTFAGEWVDLEDHIAKGRPLIVSLERNARGVPLHYVVVAGIDSTQDLVLINDPAERKLLAVPRGDFLTAWQATENWTLLAVPQIALASDAFRKEDYSKAKSHLLSALDSDPANTSAYEFLATLYFLENNMESAIKYWNRTGKPVIEDIHFDPPVGLDPILLDRSVAFGRGSVLTLDDYWTTRARLDATGVFSRYEFELAPSEGQSEERFDLTVRAAERESVRWLSWFRGLPYETVLPEIVNIGGEARNLKSLVRWDSEKRRAFIGWSAPISKSAKWRYVMDVDARDENWEYLDQSFSLRKAEASLRIESVLRGRWKLASGFAISSRQFSNHFEEGAALKYTGQLDRALLRIPERRFSLDFAIRVEGGKVFTRPTTRFARLDSSLSARWFPMTRGDDFEVAARVRSGRAFGAVPFDELFSLGLDRDHEHWLRAHPSTRDGRKGAAVIAPSYAMLNSELTKNVYDMTFLRFRLSPFLDVARTSAWHVDAGAQLRVTALNIVTFTLSYGKNLRNGEDVVFTHVTR